MSFMRDKFTFSFFLNLILQRWRFRLELFVGYNKKFKIGMFALLCFFCCIHKADFSVHLPILCRHKTIALVSSRWHRRYNTYSSLLATRNSYINHTSNSLVSSKTYSGDSRQSSRHQWTSSIALFCKSRKQGGLKCFRSEPVIHSCAKSPFKFESYIKI